MKKCGKAAASNKAKSVRLNIRPRYSTFQDDVKVAEFVDDATSDFGSLAVRLRRLPWLDSKVENKRFNTSSKSVQVSLTTTSRYPSSSIFWWFTLPQDTKVRYLGVRLDHRLCGRKDILKRDKEFKLKYDNMYCLLGRRYELHF